MKVFKSGFSLSLDSTKLNFNRILVELSLLQCVNANMFLIFNVLKTSDYWQGGQDCIGTKDTFVRADYIERGTLPSQELLEEFREGFSTDPQTMYHFETSSNYESVIVLIELLKKLQAKFPRCATLEQGSLTFGDDIQRMEPGFKW